MKVVVLYLRILKKSDPDRKEPKSFGPSSVRFKNDYLRFKPSIEHELVVVNCGTPDHDDLFDGVADRCETYLGGGYDCGAYQEIGGRQECDLVVALNTHVHFEHEYWLDLFVHTARMSGPGVYGATSSFEHNPHLRTPAICFHPEIIRDYPWTVKDRNGASLFECGPMNFSIWSEQQGYPTLLITPEGAVPKKHWRVPENIFRRGNQSNVLIFDRHTEIYDHSNRVGRQMLSNLADGNFNDRLPPLNDNPCQNAFRGVKTPL